MDGIKFTHSLLAWYDVVKRDLPWRQGREPYHIWISEIMAQQTQIDRVIGYYERWMRSFPDVQVLARASEEEVLKAWEGLGYYSRAKNILRAANVIVGEYGGCFPNDYSSLLGLPGIGDYTAGAISSIAFEQVIPAVDANVLRVFSRLFDIDTPVANSGVRHQIRQKVEALISDDRPGDFNQALMELGALVCTKKPQCEKCPVQTHCRSFDLNITDLRPVPPDKRKPIKIEIATGLLLHDGKILIQKRKPDDVWPGLWEFPGGGIEEGETPRQALVREYQEEVELDILPEQKITTISYSYTRYRVKMHCYLCSIEKNPLPVFNEAVEGRFVHPEELDNFAFPAGHRRLIEFVRSTLHFTTILS